MIRDGLYELIVVVISFSLALEIGIGIRAHTLGVVKKHMRLVRPQHINRNEVDHRLLPGVGRWVVEVLDSLYVIVLNLVQSAFVGQIPLPHDEWHGIHLEKNQVWHRFAYCLHESMPVAAVGLWDLGDAVEKSERVRCVI